MLEFSPSDYSAILLSVRVAVTATLISLPLAFAAAYVMTFKRFKGMIALDVIVNLPLTLPPVVIGYILLILLGQNGWIGQMGAAAARDTSDLHVEGCGYRDGGRGVSPDGARDQDQHGDDRQEPDTRGPHTRSRLV